MISYPRVKELLDYDPVGGVFRWRVSRGFKKRGTKASSGRITIEGRVYEAGKLAWFYMYCRWPGRNFRYLNGNKNDIRLANMADRKARLDKPKRLIGYWVRMTRVEGGFQLVLVEKHKAPVDLGTYGIYEQAAEVQKWALVCSE